MTNRKLGLGFLVVFVLAFLAPLRGMSEVAPAVPLEKAFSAQEQDRLISMFEAQFDRQYLTQVFGDPRLERIESLIKKNLLTQETHRDYADFMNPYSMHLAKRFQKRWEATLEQASRQFEVDSEVLVAILLVETGFGNVMGRYPVIGVFASLLVEFDNNQGAYPIAPGTDPEQVYYLERLAKKAEWAKSELTALLTLSAANGESPYHYKGSYAGAFGLPQFLPSSYLKWGFDGDQNGEINLSHFGDAIFSTANYLQSHGWKRGLTHKDNEEAVWAYNNSRPYVHTVLNIAKTLHDKAAKSSTQSPRGYGLKGTVGQDGRGLESKIITDKF